MNYNPAKTRKNPHSDQARRKMAVSAYERQVKPKPVTLPEPLPNPTWMKPDEPDRT